MSLIYETNGKKATNNTEEPVNGARLDENVIFKLLEMNSENTDEKKN